jgi:hypothetical protein
MRKKIELTLLILAGIALLAYPYWYLGTLKQSCYAEAQGTINLSIRIDFERFTEALAVWPDPKAGPTARVAADVLEELYRKCRAFHAEGQKDYAEYIYPAYRKQLSEVSTSCTLLGAKEKAGGITNADLKAFSETYARQLATTIADGAKQHAKWASSRVQSLSEERDWR